MPNKQRYSVDCSDVPEANCDVYISGSKKDVIEAAVQHAVGSHGFEDTPDLRREIEESLKKEESHALV